MREERQRAPSDARIRHLHRNRRLRLRHGLTAMANAIAKDGAAAGVATVYLGWPRGILRGERYGPGKWAGRIHGFWSFGLTLALLESALEARGITTVRVGERGSSSTCRACGSGDVARHPRWRLACRACGESLHSDQAGSRNILANQTPGACRDWAEGLRGIAAHCVARRLSSEESSPRRRRKDNAARKDPPESGLRAGRMSRRAVRAGPALGDQRPSWVITKPPFISKPPGPPDVAVPMMPAPSALLAVMPLTMPVSVLICVP